MTATAQRSHFPRQYQGYLRIRVQQLVHNFPYAIISCIPHGEPVESLLTISTCDFGVSQERRGWLV